MATLNDSRPSDGLPVHSMQFLHIFPQSNLSQQGLVRQLSWPPARPWLAEDQTSYIKQYVHLWL